LLGWAGLAPDPAMTGKSFAQVRQQTLPPIHDYVFAERGAHGNGFPENSSLFDLGRVVIGQRYKLIFNALWQIPYHPVDFGSQPFWIELKEQNQQNQLAEPFKTLFFRPQRPVFELFDLEKDPLELNNLAGNPAHKAIEYELKVALNKWMLLNRDYLPLPLRTADSNK
jgi:N-sulfoglucosamine sulfohydrolase